MKHLKDATNLTTLTAERTEVTDSGLEQLEGLKTLQYLNLSQTRITDNGVERLRQMLPECDVHH